MSTPKRNEPCPCGSGRRYKQCCGAIATSVPARSDDVALPHRALALHRANESAQAEAAYRQFLQQHPDDPNGLLLLGTLLYEDLRYHEALPLLVRANEAVGWTNDSGRHNLGLVIGRMLSAKACIRGGELFESVRRWRLERPATSDAGTPLVSVLVPVYNHERFVEEALRSVFAQTYRNIELIVIDDGSSDRSAEVAQRVLRESPFPATFRGRENLGAPATLNECASLARGDFLNPLNSDDRFVPARIEKMVAEVAGRSLDWGFSRIQCIGEGVGPVISNGRARALVEASAAARKASSTSFAFVAGNPMISTGNLFARRAFFLKAGGFRSLRYNHDWEFGLRAGQFSEPWWVDEPLYEYRLHGANTIAEGGGGSATREAFEMMRLIQSDLSREGGGTGNSLGPLHPENRVLTTNLALSSGQGAALPPEVLQKWAAELLNAGQDRAREPAPAPAAAPGQVAILIVGMHRTGSSALSRLLNLAGAHLPEAVLPPTPENNETGFWEPASVVHLNETLLRDAGGSWVEPPPRIEGTKARRDRFVRQVAQLLRDDYGSAPLILLKDPRLALLIDWWDGALRAAGYETLYVVSVRSPHEVARSLEQRDRLPYEQGLNLWLRYAGAVEHGMQGRAKVFVHYERLLADWRHELARIRAALSLGLPLGEAEGAVDSFLSPALRHQRRPDGGALPEAVASAYERQLSQC